MDAAEPAQASARSFSRVRSLVAPDLFRSVLGVSFFLMAANSWPLWVETDRYPRVPFITGLPTFGTIGSQVLFVAMLATTLLGISSRFALAASLALLGWLIAGDQNRFQPWAYQYLLCGLALAALPRERAWALARVFVVALYFHSGLSKLDVSFCRETGPWMVGPLLEWCGVSTSTKPSLGFLLLPAAEFMIALGLCFKKTRPYALGAALAMHTALILLMGPLGRRQSVNLLIWNASLMIENILLFRSHRGEVVSNPKPEHAWDSWIRLIFAFAAILPFGERFGFWDAWPSFALYAGHIERTEILVAEEVVPFLPEEAQNSLETIVGEPWLRLDPTRWSRAVRGTPIYPSNRLSNGLAQAIGLKVRRTNVVRVVEWSRADRFSGLRTKREAIGIDSLRLLAARFRFNSRPEGSFLNQSPSY